jgi:hypothetical protein
MLLCVIALYQEMRILIELICEYKERCGKNKQRYCEPKKPSGDPLLIVR